MSSKRCVRDNFLNCISWIIFFICSIFFITVSITQWQSVNHNIFISNWCNWALSRRTNLKWYNIIAHFVFRFEFWLKHLFFLFHFIFISSYLRATCSREKCVHTIHQFFIIEIYINRITFSCFFFFSFLSFKVMFVDVKKTLLVYYKIEILLVYYEAFVD